MDCIFCHKEKLVTDIVYEDNLVMAFMDMEPINEGHVLLVPKEHYLDVDEIPDEILSHLMRVSKKIVSALKKIYPLDGYSIMQNGGAFNDVGHYHLHIFPRYEGDGFGWTYGTGEKRVNAEIAQRIRSRMNAPILTIEDYVFRELSSEEQEVASSFLDFLKEKRLSFYKDTSDGWKDKIYYWVKSENECVCFIAIKDPEEKNNHWTVWSADMASEWLDNKFADDKIKETAWKYVDHCGQCGSCSGGRRKNIFGKEFDDVCGCTFRIDNPSKEDIPFLKKMVELRIKEIQGNLSK